MQVDMIKFYVFNPTGEHVASFKYAEDAAAFVGNVGEIGTKVSYMGELVWAEGEEELNALESYDRAAAIMEGRIR